MTLTARTSCRCGDIQNRNITLDPFAIVGPTSLIRDRNRPKGALTAAAETDSRCGTASSHKR